MSIAPYKIVKSTLPVSTIAHRLETIAARFDQLHSEGYEDTDCVLNFREVAVTSTACGTVACHGGWLSTMEFMRPDLKTMDDGVFENSINLQTHLQEFQCGAALLAAYLGLTVESRPQPWWRFAIWADQNPEVWGNDRGLGMFSSDGARSFVPYDQKRVTLATIATRYRGVAARLRTRGYFEYRGAKCQTS